MQVADMQAAAEQCMAASVLSIETEEREPERAAACRALARALDLFLVGHTGNEATTVTEEAHRILCTLPGDMLTQAMCYSLRNDLEALRELVEHWRLNAFLNASNLVTKTTAMFECYLCSHLQLSFVLVPTADNTLDPTESHLFLWRPLPSLPGTLPIAQEPTVHKQELCGYAGMRVPFVSLGRSAGALLRALVADPISFSSAAAAGGTAPGIDGGPAPAGAGLPDRSVRMGDFVHNPVLEAHFPRAALLAMHILHSNHHNFSGTVSSQYTCDVHRSALQALCAGGYWAERVRAVAEKHRKVSRSRRANNRLDNAAAELKLCTDKLLLADAIARRIAARMVPFRSLVSTIERTFTQPIPAQYSALNLLIGAPDWASEHLALMPPPPPARPLAIAAAPAGDADVGGA